MNKDVVFALVKKELYQIIRDFSSILIAFILPVILLFLFGFGINFDTNTVKIGVIIEDKTPTTLEILDAMRFSRFLNVYMFESRKEAAKALQKGAIRGFAVIPNDFTKNLKAMQKKSQQANGAMNVSSVQHIQNINTQAVKLPEIQVITDGSEPNTAKFVAAYIQGAVQTYKTINNKNSPKYNTKPPEISVIQRFWYNPALKTTYFVLPGSLAIIMTMIGTVLTALVIAREWERGTMEALLTTKVTKGEFLTAKYIAYFILAMASIAFCLFVIIFVFRVPFQGSITAFIIVSAFFMLGALGFGFLVSTISKDQFIASQIAGVVGFMPAMMLSGLIYEINSMPAFLRLLTLFIPARYYVSSISSLFLSGTIMYTIVRDSILLGLFALLMFVLVYKITPQRFDDC